MREILFRGKTKEGNWVEGFYYQYMGLHIIKFYDEDIVVIPETIGQYTGLKDKNGKKLWEGDIVEFYSAGSKYQAELFWNPKGYWCLKYGNDVNSYFLNNDKYEIIGNKY